MLRVNYFEPFMASWGAMCVPHKIGEYWYVPLGWQDELNARNINYLEVNENQITEDNGTHDSNDL